MARFDAAEWGRLLAGAMAHANFTPAMLAADLRRRGEMVTTEDVEAWQRGERTPDWQVTAALLEALEPPGGYAYFRPAYHPHHVMKLEAMTKTLHT